MSAHDPLREARDVLGKTPREVRGKTLVIVIVALALAVAGLTYSALPSTERPYRQAEQGDVVPSVSAMFDKKPALLVVGDTYASGNTDTRVVTYPYLVADKMRWSLAIDAQDGTGFVRGAGNVSPARRPFIDRLDRDAANYHVDYILIDGGRSDLDEPPDRVVMAADEYIKKVHSYWPKAKIVIMLPAYATPDVAANYPAVAQGLRRTADSVGASVIDPVAQRWYVGTDVKPSQWHDGVYLNRAGQTYYAGRIIESLNQMGLVS